MKVKDEISLDDWVDKIIIPSRLENRLKKIFLII